MRNNWILPLIEGLEKKEFYGKLVLNFCKGDIPKVKKEEDLIKPKEVMQYGFKK